MGDDDDDDDKDGLAWIGLALGVGLGLWSFLGDGGIALGIAGIVLILVSVVWLGAGGF